MTDQNTSYDELDDILNRKLFKIYNFRNNYISGKAYRFKYPSDVTKAVVEAKAALQRLLLQERLKELKQARKLLTYGKFAVGKFDERIATLAAQLSKNEMG